MHNNLVQSGLPYLEKLISKFLEVFTVYMSGEYGFNLLQKWLKGWQWNVRTIFV